MLNRRESEVMNAVYGVCSEKGVCLISPAELLALLPLKKKFDEKQLDTVLTSLSLDGYFELLSSERKGEKTYVISLRPSGYAFKRCALQQKRDTAFKIAWAVASAVIAFLVGIILKRIF
jgi:hypothetical protein